MILILNMVLVLVYMINAFSAKNVIQEHLSMYVEMMPLNFETFAYIPFIIVTILALLYFSVGFFTKNKSAIERGIKE